MIEGTTIQVGDKRLANLVFSHGRKQVSLSVDNGPLARTEKLFRSDIRLFIGQDDVTSKVFSCSKSAMVRGDIENMDVAMKWLKRSSWGFDQ